MKHGKKVGLEIGIKMKKNSDYKKRLLLSRLVEVKRLLKSHYSAGVALRKRKLELKSELEKIK